MSATKKEVAKKTTKELQREDPDFLPAIYNLKKSQLAKLKKDYDVATMPESLIKGDEGYEIIHKKAMSIVKVRTHIDKKKKELTDDARKWTNEVNAEAKKYTEIVSAIEKPWKDKKAELDNAAEIKAEAERQAEIVRTELLESKVNNIINVTANLVGATTEELVERLNLINSIVVDESYEEYEDAALTHKENAISSLQLAINERKVFEKQQEQAEKDRLEIEKGKRELAEAKAELEKLKNLTKPAEEIKTARDFTPESMNDGFGMGSGQQEEPAETITVQSEDVEPYIQLTEPKMVQAYMQKIINVEVPDVGNTEMVNLITIMTDNLKKLNNFVMTNTQVGE